MSPSEHQDSNSPADLSGLRSFDRRVDDVRHLENQRRLKKLEEDQAKILVQIQELAGLIGFLRDAKVGIKWSARLGRAVAWLLRLVTGALAAYGAWKAFWHVVFK